ncbi:MAG: DNA/RNA non-specific endonuclease, partial [Prevotella nanceiensis]
TFDYVRSGYDRGHMCPSADNKWSERAQQESFLMTNICPQAPNLNSGDWSELEQMCRSWARKWGEIHIVCGPINPQEKGRRIGPNKVLVPKGFFKVVLYNGSSPKAIGFIYPNDDTDKPLKAYATSVDEVERITGINFFASLNDKIENEIEKNYNFNDWDTSN